MCGINGFISSKALDVKKLKSSITVMNDLIVHRGPDDQGTFTYSSDAYSIALGMRRLSIIDLSTGHQPMFSETENIVIVFNGEIYNYKALRADLEKRNIEFQTESDTEVILKLYEAEGEKSFGKLDGMFAFSIYDKRIDKVFIARDFFGEKPLYYTKHKNLFLWASELKSIMKVADIKPPISTKGLNLYFRLTYIPAPYTIYEDFFKLEANNYIIYDLKTHDFNIKLIDCPSQKEPSTLTYVDAKQEVKQLVKESVESRSVSDVPIGTFLSGGVDSSIVSLCLSQMKSSKINTFSIGFEKKSFDESHKARTVAKLINSNHHEFILKEKDLEKIADTILLNFDEPFADSSSLPSYLIAKKTSEHVKVALTGDGGDEVFGGYNKYYMGRINKKYTGSVPNIVHHLIHKMSMPFLESKEDNRGFRFKAKRLLQAIDYSEDYYWDIISLGFSRTSLNQYLLPHLTEAAPFEHFNNKTNITSPKKLTEYRAIDKVMSLEGDMLVKVDRSSMLTSLECRSPFLNKKLWDFTNTLPEDYLIKGWDKKFILKDAFRDQFPKGFLDKSKIGFGVPVGDWLRSAFKEELKCYIEPKFLKDQNIFNIPAITGLVKDHLNGTDYTFKVWSFYCFQKWYMKTYLALE